MGHRESWGSRCRNALVRCEESLCLFSKKSERDVYMWHLPSGLCVTGNHGRNFLLLDFEGLGHSFWGCLACLLSWNWWLWPWLFFFFEQILISGHQPLLVSGNHTAHYTIFHNRYLWKLLAGWHFSVGRSCEQPLGMSWVCYPWDWSTTGKGDMGHCLPSAWKYSGRNL